MPKEAGAQEDAGDGAPAGESLKPGDPGYVAPKDGDKDYVPKAQFLAALKSANEKYQALEVQLAEMKGRQSAGEDKADQPKRYTKAELNAAVQASQITADVADEVWAKQIREDAKNEAKREVLDVVRAEKRQERINSDLAEYKRLAPEILDDGHETRQKIRDEFNYLVTTLGSPQTVETELAAIRAVLGPIDRLKTARSARREAEAHEETGGGGGGGGEGRKTKTGFDALDKRTRDYYDGQIAKGLYKDRKAVEEELKFARPRAR
jgi:hypothetical protein